ncbi:NAD(P)H-hydrate dehydratase [Ideonella sp. A 288]|uniref:NAD(P)H-hydrate dehydratase n=1 Tax=Ideonella sp. A 288 TaxID=1962181 RepID=UPI000B4A7AF7|nr:NAD(P)H-hydrate dehydratase [Ideonella sp. A 288]
MRQRPTTVAVLPSIRAWPLHDAAATRGIERAALQALPPHALMQRAGLALARLALAVAPHARRLWIAAGPGNNGGDGLVAARWLHQAGRSVRVSLLGDPQRLPDDARDAHAQALQAGVPIGRDLPDAASFDLSIDALLGLGASRAPAGDIAAAIRLLNAAGAPVLAVDLPSGLSADRGQCLGDEAVRATHTLSLLTLKPGLFTAEGRDHCGSIWLDTLGLDGNEAAATARLIGPPVQVLRRHSQHKGSFGDVIVVGGAQGMGGAAMLAARAALTAGAGRVYLARLDGNTAPDPGRPELMPRQLADVLRPGLLGQSTVVCGCGGGDAVADCLPVLVHHAARLVLDADALNAIAISPSLQAALRARASHGLATVATPHPLEASRWLGTDTATVQSDRLRHAEALAQKAQCTVVLKGSGSVLASPGMITAINPTGSARLATAGTGDVLAGWLGGLWSQQPADASMDVACAGVWAHGRAADDHPPDLALRAGDLIEALARRALVRPMP